MEDQYADHTLNVETFAKKVQHHKGELENWAEKKSFASSELIDYQRFLKRGLSLPSNLPTLYQEASGE